MKQKELLRHLRQYGCFLKRQGKEHELWCNPLSGRIEAVPRHQEIANLLRLILQGFGVTGVKKQIGTEKDALVGLEK